MNFEEVIKRDREKIGIRSYEGNFIDYLEKVKENPDLAKLSHKRVYDVIMSFGSEVVNSESDEKIGRIHGNEIIKRYKYFENDFFGIEKVIMKIMNYLYSASMKGEESRQVLYLVGPVGAGKSSIVEALKKIVEKNGEIYALKGCPMQEEPLHLIPEHLREDFNKFLGVEIEGELCPVCANRLEVEYENRYEDFKIVKSKFSIAKRRGVGVVPPVDPNNQDTSVLNGSVDISKMDLYPEDDPRVFSLNGAFNVANRGLVEFIEVFKNDIEYLHTIITATQEKAIPSPGKGSMIYFDGLIIAHSNEAEWNKFKSDHTNEAILDRIVKIEVPYCLEVDEEVKIYKKILKKSRFKAHIAPNTLKIAAMFAILTRINPSEKVDLMTKLKIYNGEEVFGAGSTKRLDIEELKDEVGKKEGMQGVSTRFIIKAIDNALCNSEDNCISPLDIIDSLIKSVKDMDIVLDDKRRYLEFLQNNIRKEYNKILEEELKVFFIRAYKDKARDLFNNYLDNVEGYISTSKAGKIKKGLFYNENFLREIEEYIGISENSAKGFRQDVFTYIDYLKDKNKVIDYISYEPIEEAINKKLMLSIKDLYRVISSDKIRDLEQLKRYEDTLVEMIDKGYCTKCSNKILKYASNNLWKD